jgi:ABC-type iron transport system FetAB permease component
MLDQWLHILERFATFFQKAFVLVAIDFIMQYVSPLNDLRYVFLVLTKSEIKNAYSTSRMW